jgi:3-hydroxyacyl-CoA dehydrogenase/enoyl-CoA hydratase/3-hydroxybutyryl-CoA epimerase
MSAAAPLSSKSMRAAARQIFTFVLRPDGVAVLTIDDTNEPLNTITTQFGEELLALVDRVESDAAVKAAVLISHKQDSFVVGANIDLLRSIKLAMDAERMATELSRGLVRLGAMSKPFVAAVHGAALGGGFELALACDAIVASDDRKTVLGLPEVQLGLIPAANGLLRIAERAGLQVALDLGLTGKSVRPARAKKLALVDEVCPSAVLLEAACARAKDLAARPAPRSPRRPAAGLTQLVSHLASGLTRLKSKELTTAALEDNPFGRALLFKKARQTTRERTHGHYPATERIIDVLERFGGKGFASAAALEAKAFGELVVSETAHRLIEIFFATTALKKDGGVEDRTVKPRDVERVLVLGGGLMGGGIASITLDAGIQVRLKEKDDAGLGRGMKHVRGVLDERLRRHRITTLQRDVAFARLTGTTDYSGLAHVDVVIEAVFEDLALKQSILREVEAHARPTCIFASNTSSIPIARIAEASRHPETVIGMHYFSPVQKMPLLEVIRSARTAPEVVATAVALGKKQGKTVIVVKDGAGFYTSRILAPYMNEAAHLLAEGVAIESIDRALIAWGWPVGPIQLLDEVGIDVAAHVGGVVHAAFGDRMLPPDALAALVHDDRQGRKNGRGFYRYDDDARRGGVAHDGKRQVDASVYRAIGVEPKAKLPGEEIQMRCSLQLVNEALLAFGEGILRSPRDGDVGAIFGLGFPPFRGGPFRYVDTLGAAEVLRRVRGYEMRFGRRWTPAPLLVDMARTGGRFYKD